MEDDEIHETNLAALLSNWQRFNGKGKGKSKGKGKVKGKGKGKYKGNNLSLEERKKRLAELKSRTNCQACGARGHLGRRRHLSLRMPRTRVHCNHLHAHI